MSLCSFKQISDLIYAPEVTCVAIKRMDWREGKNGDRKTHQNESGACVTPGVDSVPLVPVSHGDQKLALQLGGQAPSRAAEKTEEESTGQRTGP